MREPDLPLSSEGSGYSIHVGETATLGFLLGLAAGLSPGPLLALLVDQTLRHGARAGLKVSLAPLLTDAPIVGAALILTGQLGRLEPVLDWLAAAGGAYLIALGCQGWHSVPITQRSNPSPPASLRKALYVNWLNPHVYLFWFTAGTSFLLRASSVNRWAPAGFLVCFYSGLCGSKALIAVALDRTASALAGRSYRLALRLTSLALVAAGLWLLLGAIGIHAAVAPPPHRALKPARSEPHLYSGLGTQTWTPSKDKA